VVVDRSADEGARGTILATVRVRCEPGHEVVDLSLEFSQAGVTQPVLSGPGFPCDGRWHELGVSSLEGFDPGPATLTARLTVADSGTGAVAPPAVDTQQVEVVPAAAVRLPGTAVLRPDGGVRLVLRARCATPWVLQELTVRASQGDDPTVASDDAAPALVCDGDWHRVVVLLGSADPAFTRGPAQVEAVVTVLDPESFDPVAQARETATVRIV
jgi:hypothetical protein